MLYVQCIYSKYTILQYCNVDSLVGSSSIYTVCVSKCTKYLTLLHRSPGIALRHSYSVLLVAMEMLFGETENAVIFGHSVEHSSKLLETRDSFSNE